MLELTEMTILNGFHWMVSMFEWFLKWILFFFALSSWFIDQKSYIQVEADNRILIDRQAAAIVADFGPFAMELTTVKAKKTHIAQLLLFGYIESFESTTLI